MISATRSDSTRPSPVSTLRSLTRAAPSSTTVFSDRRQIAKSWSTLGSTRDAAVSCVSRRTTRPPSSNGSRLYSSSSATSMPTAPIAMAAASERPPMIVSAGYFSSRRAPSFQSSHETMPSRGRRARLLCASPRPPNAANAWRRASPGCEPLLAHQPFPVSISMWNSISPRRSGTRRREAS